MSTKKISELPAGNANANAVVPATNAAGTTTEKVTLGSIAALGGGPPASHVHAAGDISSGTLDAARIPAQITPTGVFEVRAASSGGTRGSLRLTNSLASQDSNLDIGIGNPGYFDGQAIVAINGTRAFRINNSPAGQVSFEQGFRMPNNAQMIGDENANAYLNMNNGAGTLQISSVTAMEFQKSYTVVGRWDTNGAFHIGSNNVVAGATTNGGVIVAGAYARSRLSGQMVTSGGRITNTGDAQASTYHLRNSTTDATAKTLFLNGSSDRLTVPAQSTWSFIARIAAYNSTDNEGAAWIVRGAIRRNNANGTAIVGTVQTDSFLDAGMSSASVDVTADDTNEALQISVTGIASKNIVWHAVVETSEVSAGAAS